MLNLDAIKSTSLQSDPYDWALVEHAIQPADAKTLLASFPVEDFWVIEDDDGEKSYSYAARPLVTLGADRIAPLAPLAQAWQELGRDLLSPSYRHALGELIGRPLDTALMEASIWRWDANAQLGPHRDLANKIVTQVFYLSNDWDPVWGGCLRILGSNAGEDLAAELPPINGTASVLVRSERSWHSVTPVRGAAPEPRRSVIVTWFRPGSSSPVWSVDDDGGVACVAAGSVRERARAGGRKNVAKASSPRRSGSPSDIGRDAAIQAPRGWRQGRVISEDGSSDAALRVAVRSRVDAPPTTRVAMVGTFDIANFGDLLLPLIAARELRERLGSAFEPTLYSYRPMSGSAWPFEVRSLARLPHEVEHFDLLLVGGGQIIRFDRAYPDGYVPTDLSVHHPLGLWLTPMLLAAAVGVPVAWNAPGVAADIPEWLDPPIAAAVKAAAHVVVRDEISARMIAAHVPDAPVRIVPDTGFGVGALLTHEPSDEFTALMAQLGIEDDYVILQPSAELRGVSRAVREVIGAARERGLAVLELPFSPTHGDRPGELGALGETVTPAAWPGPLMIAELVARARAVIAQSFHAGVVAVATGVPLFRPPSPPGWKYEALEGIAGVHPLKSATGDGLQYSDFERDARYSPNVAARERVAQLSSHWDAVAEAARSGKRRGPAKPALELIAGLPHWMHAREEAAVEAFTAQADALEAQRAACEAAAAVRVGALETDFATLLQQKDDLAARVSLLAGDLAAVRARTAALEDVRNRKIVKLGLALTSPLAMLARRGRRSEDPSSR
jgi:hypothetical protein